MGQLVYKDQNIIFLLSYLNEYNRFKTKIIISKKDIRKAVDRNRMRRKMRFLFNYLKLNSNICCKIIVKGLYEFKIHEYQLIKDTIIKNAYRNKSNN